MFETSVDILNIVKAVSIFALAAFASWVLFYLAMIFKELFKIIKEMRSRFNKIDDLIKTLKEKIEHSTSYLFLMSEGMKKLVEMIGKYTGRKDKHEDKNEKDKEKIAKQ